MNLITVTYNADTHQLVPREPTPEWVAKYEDNVHYQVFAEQNIREVLVAAPQPETLSPWLPIETAPKDGEQFYVTGYNYGVVGAEMWHDVAFRNKKGGIASATTHDFLQFAVYWMPLPAPPKPEQ